MLTTALIRSYLPLWTGSRSHREAGKTPRFPPGGFRPGRAEGFPSQPGNTTASISTHKHQNRDVEIGGDTGGDTGEATVGKSAL